MVGEENSGALAAELVQMSEKIPARIQLARHTQVAHVFLGVDAVDEHLLQPAVVVKAAIDQPCDEADGPHFTHHAGVERQRIDDLFTDLVKDFD